MVSPREDLFPAYERAINRIQDYFEYANDSKQDREFVKGVLNQLNADCHAIKLKHTRKV